MPENIEAVPLKNFTILSLENVERKFRFAPHVKSFGDTVTPPHSVTRSASRTELEFCFRFSSTTEEIAIDKLDGVYYRNTFPHLFIKHPNVSYFREINGERDAFFIIYKPDTVSLFESCGIPLDPPFVTFEMTQEISSLAERLKQCYTSTRQTGVADHIDMLALELIEKVFLQKQPRQGNAHEERIREIASFLEYHPMEKMDFNNLAKKYGLSRRSFFRYWEKVYNMPPAQYRLQKRMEQAEHLLLSRDWSIAEAAEHLGYPGASCFIQAFKAYFGKTPAVWKKEHKSSEG